MPPGCHSLEACISPGSSSSRFCQSWFADANNWPQTGCATCQEAASRHGGCQGSVLCLLSVQTLAPSLGQEMKVYQHLTAPLFLYLFVFQDFKKRNITKGIILGVGKTKESFEFCSLLASFSMGGPRLSRGGRCRVGAHPCCTHTSLFPACTAFTLSPHVRFPLGCEEVTLPSLFSLCPQVAELQAREDPKGCPQSRLQRKCRRVQQLRREGCL